MRFIPICLLGTLLLFAACDSTLPDDPEPRLVVEGFIGTDEPLPEIRLSKTGSLKKPYSPLGAAVNDADVLMQIGSRSVSYAPDPVRPGVFRPVESSTSPARGGDAFVLTIDWNGERATAGGVVPPPIRLLSADVVVPDEPVSAVLLDSLLLSDSLAVGAHKGYIYPVEVTLSWEEIDDPADEFWIRAQLSPYSKFSSTVVDFFLRSEEIFEEAVSSKAAAATRTWTGVYAVGVAAGNDPVPAHDLRISLIRSGRDYARFASSRGTPERREPISNLNGAIGIFTAISVDSTRVRVGPTR